MWHVTHDIWHVERGEHSLKVSGPLLIRFASEGVLKIGTNWITDWLTQCNEWMNEWMSNEGDCGTALATPGLLKTLNCFIS